MRWLVADTLYCPEALFASHLDSYSHYLREFGEDVRSTCLNIGGIPGLVPGADVGAPPDVVFVLDQYEHMGAAIEIMRLGAKKPVRAIAQVAAVCPKMPWEIRKADGSPVFDCVISSIPWMVDAARAAGCRSELMPLAFDTRARVCGMGVERDLGCIFIGTIGGNHQRRSQLLAELSDIVTVMPPVFGRDYFRTLARAKVVISPHAEWARGAKNNMRLFEAAGMGAQVVTDGVDPEGVSLPGYSVGCRAEASDWRRAIVDALGDAERGNNFDECSTLVNHGYEKRIPRLVEIARSLNVG